MSLEQDIIEVKKLMEADMGMISQAHNPKNVILVWWFRPSTGEFFGSADPDHIHSMDYNVRINPLELNTWVKGRVFRSGDRVINAIYDLRGMSEHARWDLLDKLYSAVRPTIISSIIDLECRDISNLFEGTCYKLTPSKTGYWKVVDGILTESEVIQ